MMMELVRLEKSSDGVFGVLLLDKMVYCATLELPELGNKPRISCIPEGRYKVVIHKSPKFGPCLLVLDVPERSEILIHPGNTMADTAGCILVGQYWGKLRFDRAVLNSGETFRELYRYAIMAKSIILQVSSWNGEEK